MLADSAFDQQRFSNGFPTGVENNFWSLARTRLIVSELEKVRRERALSSSSRLLEVGCGPGIVLSALRRAGWAAQGVDLGRPTLLPGMEEHIFDGVRAEDLSMQVRMSVDGLLLFDVIEHLEDDVGFLRGLLKSFPNCKFVALTVPARKEAWSYYDEYYGHHRRYTKQSISETMAHAGLDPLSTRYFFHSLYLAAITINLLGRKRSIVIEQPRYPSLHRITAKCIDFEHAVIGALGIVPGLSLFAAGKR